MASIRPETLNKPLKMMLAVLVVSAITYFVGVLIGAVLVSYLNKAVVLGLVLAAVTIIGIKLAK